MDQLKTAWHTCTDTHIGKNVKYMKINKLKGINYKDMLLLKGGSAFVSMENEKQWIPSRLI